MRRLLACSVLQGEKAPVIGAPVTVSFRPERTGIVAQSSRESALPEGKEINKLSGKVEAALFLGEFFEYSVKIGEFRLKARSQTAPPIPIDAPVLLTIAPENCLALSDEVVGKKE